MLSILYSDLRITTTLWLLAVRGIEETEKMIPRNITLTLILLMSFVLGSGAALVRAGENLEEMSTEDTLYVRGLVSRVYLDKMQISVRPPKGDSIRITIDPDTILEGVSLIDDFQKEQQVKVWYSVDKGSNLAIKIIKMMELGC